VLRPLTALTIAFKRKPSGFPSTLSDGQSQKLMPRKNVSIPHLQSRGLRQCLRLRKPAADWHIDAQCLKKPFHGITPTGENAAGCDKNTGRIRMERHGTLINGGAHQLNAKVS
jgi:hypothetical protein